MPTVVDSLIVELGLDPSKFEKGQKAALLSFAKTKDAAQAAGKQIEVSGNVAAESINKITKEVGALFALFLGGRGIVEFTSQITAANAALGRFAGNLGEIPQSVAEWETAAQAMGGTASDTAGTFERLGQALFDLHRNGKTLPKEFSQLQALTGVKIDTEHGVNRFLLDTAAALQKLNAVDPSQAYFLAKGMGIDAATTNVMIQYGAAVGSYLQTLKQYAPTSEEIKNSQALQTSWSLLGASTTALGNAIQNDLVPYLVPMIEMIRQWVDHNRELISSKISEEVKIFADYLKTIDWNALTAGMGSFADNAAAVAKAINDVVDGIKYLAQLNENSKNWTITKFLNASQNIDRGTAAVSPPSAGRGNVGGAAGTVNVIPGIRPKNARASGGPVSGGDSYLVGERGPEIFRPGTGGTIIPNGGLGGDTKVDGKPVNKSNPMPVTLQSDGSSGSGGGLWDSIVNAGKNFLGTGGSKPGGSGGTGGSAGPVAPVKGNTLDRARRAVDYFVSQGLPKEAAIGIVAGTIGGESDYGAANQQRGDKGTAFGIGQWHMDRVRQILAATGIDVRTASFEDQLKAMRWEMENGPGGGHIWNKLKNANRAEAVRLGVVGFERPLNQAADVSKRLGMAAGLSNSLGTTSTAGRTPAGARHAAKLSTIQNSHHVTTSSTSNELHVGQIHVNAPNATDASGIASGISDALRRQQIASTFNSGPA